MAVFSDYFNRREGQEPNPGLKSPPSTRPLAALPLVTSIRHLGLDKLKNRTFQIFKVNHILPPVIDA